LGRQRVPPGVLVCLCSASRQQGCSLVACAIHLMVAEPHTRPDSVMITVRFSESMLTEPMLGATHLPVCVLLHPPSLSCTAWLNPWCSCSGVGQRLGVCLFWWSWGVCILVCALHSVCEAGMQHRHVMCDAGVCACAQVCTCRCMLQKGCTSQVCVADAIRGLIWQAVLALPAVYQQVCLVRVQYFGGPWSSSATTAGRQ
jgi:hypothetical protein